VIEVGGKKGGGKKYRKMGGKERWRVEVQKDGQ
jgi:hypothetical protein